LLIQRLSTESSAAVRAAIIGTLDSLDCLREAALTAYFQADRQQALSRLRSKEAGAASGIAEAQAALARRAQALSGESNPRKLLALVLEGEFDVLRAAAARRLADAAALEQAALRCRQSEVQRILLAKIADRGALKRIAAGAADPAMALAASRKAGEATWVQIFQKVTAKGAADPMLGAALAAVSLFPEVQPDATEAVQEACLNLIRRGDESRIPEMVDLLEGYGDKTLAEDYLNCGQPDLDGASRTWAARRGYSVGTGMGSNRAAWGSDR
jgi:hypothetical protein